MVNFEIKDLTGKTVVVTGGSAGLGKASCLEFARMNANLIILSRNESKTLDVINEIKNQTGNDKIEFVHIDLADLESVRRAAKEILSRKVPIDILMNNAGVAGLTGITVQGFEIHFGTNLLGPILLTELLLPLLKAAPQARIVNLSSLMGIIGRNYDWDNLHGPAWSLSGVPVLPYCDTKLGMSVYTKKLAQLLKDTNVTCYSVNPGAVFTEIYQKALPWFIVFLFRINPLYVSEEEGVKTQLYCSLQDGIEEMSGGYFSNCQRATILYSRILDDQGYIDELYEKTLKLIEDYS
jgi:NAD(P)-dependent dehydrogenase (short-subunit alcohol dehydrogenase family)